MDDRTPSVGAVATHKAFTLIELLVVISIVALLMAILMPALKHGRAAAHQSVCLSNLRQSGIAIGVYATEFDGYVPNANTSGYNPSAIGLNKATSPIQRDDWMSPMFGNYLGLPANRGQRLVALFNDEFYCPANKFMYDDIYSNQLSITTPAKSIRFNSYSAPITMQNFWDANDAKAKGYREPVASGANSYVGPVAYGNGHDQRINPTRSNYRFTVDSMGSASMKVAAMDGSRYWDWVSNRFVFTFNGESNPNPSFGVNFTDRGPGLNVVYIDNGSPYKMTSSGELTSESRALTYRHLSSTLNMVFYDGHAGNFDSRSSRSVDFFWPRGSRVDNTFEIGDLTARVGQIVR